MTKYVNIIPPCSHSLTWIVGQHRPGPHGASLHVLGDGDGHQAPPVPPVPVEDPAAAQPEEHVEDTHDGAELYGVAGSGRSEDGISGGENDHVQDNADHVDGKAEEDWVLVLVVDNTPDKTEEKQQVVDEESLPGGKTNYSKLDVLVWQLLTSVPQSPRLDQEIRTRWEKKRSFSLILGMSGHSSLISWYPMSTLGGVKVWNIIQLFSHNSPSDPAMETHHHHHTDRKQQTSQIFTIKNLATNCFAKTGLKWGQKPKKPK